MSAGPACSGSAVLAIAHTILAAAIGRSPVRRGSGRHAHVAAAFALLLATCASGLHVAHAAPASRPNVLLVTADDLGFSDLGVTGGEIPTPTLDRLARGGVLLTQFNTMPTCSPSRAALLTGRHPHRVGLGAMAELTAPNQRGRPGYEGYLIDGVPTLASELRALGYATYLAGKWHLGDLPGRWPIDRGFERSFAMLHGGAGHMDMRGYSPLQPEAAYVADGRAVRVDAPFYSSDLYVDRLLEFVRSDRERPFFAYLAYTAPHAPLQAPDALLESQRARYEPGWDVVRAARFDRLRQLGLVGRDAALPPRWPMVPAWDELDSDQRDREVRRMAAYAAMVEGLDRSLGGLLDALARDGRLDDTVVVFLSDNGAEASDFSVAPGMGDWFRTQWNNAPANIGRGDSYAFPGAGWAQVSTTPNRLFKGLPTSGGIRSPAIVSWPGRWPAGRRVDAFTSILDVMPTLLEVAGGAPASRDLDGRSLAAVLAGRAARARADGDGVGIELLGHRAYFDGRWKAVWLRAPWGDGRWQLFDLTNDAAETRDVAASHPDVVARLAAAWAAHAARVGVIDVPSDFQPYPIVFGPHGPPPGFAPSRLGPSAPSDRPALEHSP